MAGRHGRSGVAASAVALVAVLLAVVPAVLAAPSPAAGAPTSLERRYWVYDVRPAGMPATDVLARTLDSVDAQHLVAWEGGRLDVTVVLGAEPTADTDGLLHVGFGPDPAGGGCVPSYEIVTGTATPADGVTRDGATLTTSRALASYQGERWRCSVAWLTAPGDTAVTDRLDGRIGRYEVIDPAAEVRIREVTHRRLPRDRWSYVRVHLRNVGYAVQEIRVRGHGRGLEVGRAVVRGDFPTGATLTLDVPVLLEARRHRHLTLVTHPRGHDVAFTFTDEERVRVRPRR